MVTGVLLMEECQSNNNIVFFLTLPDDKREGTEDVSGSTLGKWVELMSPIPTKKSSMDCQEYGRIEQGKWY